ncbi:FecR family protein [Oceanobacter antarcticus]|uniref:FecR domain-containing protein n=1 Tax=Oceanobacter antarcticus TaxID=3133425 RepID=A0ABW8NKX1_9GAMM
MNSPSDMDATKPLIQSLDEQAFQLIQQQHEARTNAATAQVTSLIHAFGQRSAEHHQALARARQDWELFGLLARPALTQREKLALHIATQSAALQDQPRRLIAISALLLVCVCLPLLWQQAHSPDSITQSAPVATRFSHINYQTGYGEQVRHTLPDGSLVTLNWNSEIVVEYSPEQRQVTLLRGEFFVNVAKNPNRPFIVISGTTRSQAVGTAYNVRQLESGTTRVTVTEGIVVVSLPHTSATRQQTAHVSANQSVDMTNSRIGTVVTVAANATTAWQTGALVFNQQPLREVLAEINRYTRYHIDSRFLPEPEVPVTATYFIDQTDEAIRSLLQLFRLRANRQMDGTTSRLVLRPAPPQRPAR